jgi:transcriptional regulator with XRE-family HTH domain
VVTVVKFSDNLYRLRKINNLKASDISRKLNVPLKSYLQYENGIIEPPFNIAEQIADYYNISLDELRGRKPSTLFEDMKLLKSEDWKVLKLVISYPEFFKALADDPDLYFKLSSVREFYKSKFRKNN